MTNPNQVPAAAPSSDMAVMPPGIHLVKIDSVEQFLKSDGTPRLDSLGYPAFLITFRTRKNDAGQVPKIRDFYYYDDRPANDPTRSDPKTGCKSAWKLGNLRKALGVGEKDALSWEKAMTIAFYAQVAEIRYIHPDDANKSNPNVLKKYSELTSNFWPKDTPQGCGMHPHVLDIPGDPAKSESGEPSKGFLKYKVATLQQISKWEGENQGNTENLPPQGETTNDSEDQSASSDDTPDEF